MEDAMRVTPRSSRLRPITASLLVVLPLVLVISGPTGTSTSSAAARLQPSTATASPPRSRQFAHSFVIRSGPRLYVAGRPFRFGGANIEWLGLAGYGPFEPNGPHFPSNYEIDDAMTTAREMGVTVVRSQTMGDSVGCDQCLEPTLGHFNPAAFERVDYALKSARARGIKIIPTIIGDDSRGGGTGCVYLRWRSISVPGCSIINMPPFWTDQKVMEDVKEHIKKLFEHVNVYTHVAYKNDPTILGWDLLNGGGSPSSWTQRIVRYVRSLDSHHLILSGYANAAIRGVDLCVGFIYPHWSQPLASVKRGIARCKAAGKPFAAYEYGWDRTNFPTLRGLRIFLRSLENTPEIVGDAFWALQAHNDGHGWMPIPADLNDPATALHVETGQWWALYYTGIQTLVSTAVDMAARAQMLRRHIYVMRGVRLPAHAIPPAPVITSAVYGPNNPTERLGARIYWQGSAGARNYSVQRATAAGGPWATVCRRCATDLDDGYVDEGSGAKSSWYRLIAYNIGGRPGPASNPSKASTG
jgi:mannan endo-1,4-beta-mannosidase